MDQLRRVLDTIRQSLSKLTISQQLLIGSMVVVLLMTLFVVSQYTGRTQLVPLLPGASQDDQQAALRFVQANNIEHVYGPGGVLIPVEQQQEVIGRMAEQQALPSDNSTLFDNLIDKQSWTMSQQQNAQLETIAVQNELNRIISQFSGIKSAKVILNLPERRPLGQPAAEASASATVFSANGLNQTTVDAIAHLIASARGIPIHRVRIVDGTTNRQWKPKANDEVNATNALELLVAIEERKRTQLYDMLSSYIKGVIVTVHAQVDVRQVRKQTTHVPQEGKGSWNPVTREDTRESSESQPLVGGEPGPRSNNGADIAGLSGGNASRYSESTTQTDFSPQPGRETEEVLDPRGYATKINAVVNIPRFYFAEIWRRQQPVAPEGQVEQGAPADPTDQDLEPIRVAEIERIKREVEKMIDTSAGEDGIQGEAEVSMIPTSFEHSTAPMEAEAGLLGLPVGSQAMGQWAKTIGLGFLAVLSLGLVLITALKASKREPLPSAHDLVGIPPALRDEGDLIGEATEADAQLEGIELSDDEMKSRKILEQVMEMVKEEPEEAAGILSKWIAKSA